MDKMMVLLRSAVLILLLQVLLVGCAGRGVSPGRPRSERSLAEVCVARPYHEFGYVDLSVLSRSETRNVLSALLPPLSDANRSMSLREVVEDVTKRVVVLPPDLPERSLMKRPYESYHRGHGFRRPEGSTVGELFASHFYVFDRENRKVGFRLVTVCTRRYIQLVPIVDDHYDPRWLDHVLERPETRKGGRNESHEVER